MKKTIIKTLVISFMAIAILGACNSPSKQVENAQTNVEEANKELDEANVAYLVEVDAYKKDIEQKIAANNKSITEFNARVDKDKRQAKADYKNRIAELEQKNTDMKKRLDEYKESGKDNWEKFKTEFNHDMEELGNAFRDFTVKNTK
jgi:hypothetical protein